MRTITKTYILNKHDSEYLTKLLSTEPTCESECFGEDETYSITIKFPNNFEVDIKCCGVQYEEPWDDEDDEDDEDICPTSNLPWTEAVLFCNGSECCCTEPSDGIFGEWELECDGVRYIIYVEKGDSDEDIIKGDDTFTYDVVLCEKPFDEGLTLEEIQTMYPMLNNKEAYPIEIEAREHGSSAMGFITPEAADTLDYSYTELMEYIASILDDMNKENSDCCYTFNNLAIYLSRNF